LFIAFYYIIKLSNHHHHIVVVVLVEALRRGEGRQATSAATRESYDCVTQTQIRSSRSLPIFFKFPVCLFIKQKEKEKSNKHTSCLTLLA
jgi:hypothetical protein